MEKRIERLNKVADIVFKSIPELQNLNIKFEIRPWKEQEDGALEISKSGNLTELKIPAGRGFCHWESTTGRTRDMVYTIVVFTNYFEEFSDMPDLTQQRFGDFLSGIGMHVNDDVDFLFVLLHELGHLFHRYEFISHKTANLEDLDLLHGINEQAVRLVYDLDRRINGKIVYTTLLFTELYADKFAMSKFIPIWNKLKQEGLVEEV